MPRLLALGCAALTMFTLTSSAMAQETPDKLLKYTHQDTGMLIGVDVKGASSSPLYAELLTAMKNEADIAKAMAEIKSKAGFDLEKDLSAVVVSMPTPKGNGNNLGKQFVIVLSGKFDAKRFGELVKEEKSKRTVGKFEVVSPEAGVDLSLINGTTAVIISGPDDYREKAWATIQGKGKSASDHPGMGKLIKAANIKKNHLWLMANMRELDQPSGPQVNTGILEISLKSGMAINARLKMKTAEDATKAKEDLEKSLPQGKMMLGMFGADALIDNLKTTVAKDLMTLDTSMTDAQLKQSIKIIKEQQQKQKSAPPAAKE